MGIFTDSHQESILGVVEGFERVIFKGYFAFHVSKGSLRLPSCFSWYSLKRVIR